MARSVFACQSCGYKNPKWMGRCPECQEYNTLVEEVEVHRKSAHGKPIEPPIPLPSIVTSSSPRISSEMSEVDRVFGGGVVQGSVALIGGDPGIGKSTLILQIADRIAKKGTKVLYVTAEESAMQVKLRSERLGVTSENLLVAAETEIETIVAHLESCRPALAIVDSIQMVYRADVSSSPGSVSQVRACAAQLTEVAKEQGTALIIVSHVTKEGSIAGPKTLEHMVDSVFYFEGDRFQAYRILRSIKNRFGSTQEVGIFQMQADGLAQVANPSELFMSTDRRERIGSVVVPTVVGTRTLLVEVQALTARSVFGIPTRRVTGVDFNRVCMILAVLERRCGIPLGTQDVYVNAVGGAQVEEPAADVAIAMAIVSNFRGTPVDPTLLSLGEIGLAAEIRGVSQAGLRLAEAKRLGFAKAIVPKDNARGFDGSDIKLVVASNLREVLELSGLF